MTRDLRELIIAWAMIVATTALICGTGSDVREQIPCAHDGVVHYVQNMEVPCE